MNTTASEEFAAQLMRFVRDPAIRAADAACRPDSNSPRAKRWREVGAAAAAPHVVPDVVDMVIFQLLNAIDQGAMKLSYAASDGTVVDLTSAGEGELGGTFMLSDGWRAKYSSQRFIDYLANMNTWPPKG